MEYKIGDKVVYPNHGVGVVEQISYGVLNGRTERYFMIRIISSGLRVMVPSSNAPAVGLRSVIRSIDASKVLGFLEKGKLNSHHDWKHRFKEIRAFEQHLVRNGTIVLKFHLRISKDEQRKRFLARLDEPFKRWKFSPSDVAERKRWDDYMAAYEDMIRETSTDYAPWYVVPADHKHVAWLVVSAAIIEALQGLKLEYPKVTGKALERLKEVERALRAEKPAGADKKSKPR